LQCEFARVGVAAVDVICEEGDVEAAEVGYRWQVLEEEVLRKLVSYDRDSGYF